MAEYQVTMYATIEADSDQEAFEAYCNGDYIVDDHKLERWVEGHLVEVDEYELENY